MIKAFKFIFTGAILTVLFIMFLNLPLCFGRTKEMESTSGMTSLLKPLDDPCVQQRTHRVAKYCFTLTNWGFIGSQAGGLPESEGGCFMPTCSGEIPSAESFHYPCGTDLDYLFQGALWIGAVVEGETLVSVGADGWLGVYEMYPGTEGQGGCIKEKTIRPTTPCCPDPDTAGAVSEQDIIAIYSDTATIGVNQDDYDRRPHKPIGIQVEQRSYSWSYDYAEDFALIDFTVRNIGTKDVRNIWLGFYIDADVYHTSKGAPGSFDDISGYRTTYPSALWADTLQYQDTINVAWIADNDGDLVKGVPGPRSVTGVTGVRVVRAPTEDISFNWWMSEGNDPVNLDWGPHLQSNWDLWIKNYGIWCEGGKGTPCGDKLKYFIMSNQEWDYDQIYSCTDKSAEGWIKPPEATFCGDMADGYDTRYLFSFGPILTLSPGDSHKVTVGYIAGENFHTQDNRIDANNPTVYYNKLDFSDFATNARWAGWVYDNPGVDTPDPVSG
ncbi:MAG: hypothetical protein OEV55_03865, partial [candidate division Zixibacteria bacterium]|nr:hypothetical protein [candidate division Zixibacteria bacterium]